VRLRDLVGHGAAIAGHGLLRVAHSVRAIRRFDSPIRRADLDEALRYWAIGNGIAPDRLINGTATVDEVLAAVPRLAPMSAHQMLSDALAEAANIERVARALSELSMPTDPLAFLDSLALASTRLYLTNTADAAFAFIHGVTVPNMARTLVPYLDRASLKALLSSVAGFVIYAIAAFDEPGHLGHEIPDIPLVVEEIARMAAATNDDHTIKFADACLSVAGRTGSTIPLEAALVRTTATS